MGAIEGMQITDYESTIVSLVRIQWEYIGRSRKDMDIHILPTFTRVDIRDKVVKSVRTINIERTSNFNDVLLNILYELNN